MTREDKNELWCILNGYRASLSTTILRRKTLGKSETMDILNEIDSRELARVDKMMEKLK